MSRCTHPSKRQGRWQPEGGRKATTLLMVNAGAPRRCRRFQAQRFGFLDALAEDEENSVIVYLVLCVRH